jgi:transposase InsO family protein
LLLWSKEIKEYLKFRRKLFILNYTKEVGKTTKALKEFGINKSTFYKWKKAYEAEGPDGLIRKKPIARSHPKAIKPEVIDKVLDLRKHFQLGSWRIKWYLERYLGISISESSVTRILVRNGVSKLQNKKSRRTLYTKRYSKHVPGHHIQMDVKFITLKDRIGKTVRRFQYTAIDDATRIRALKVYSKHNQVNAIDFADYVIEKFPFRIHTIRTDRGHEFQAKFHWHIEDLGIRHQYIKPRSPQLNGKVERSHLTDEREFYQLLTFTDDVDLNKKIEQWEQFYNFDRPHGSLDGKTPYEVLRFILKN